MNGKNIERRREGDDWNFKFEVGGQQYRGPCYTKDKQAAEAMAAQLKQETRQGAHEARDAAQAAIAKGEPFILFLPSREGSENFISNIDRRDIVALLKAQLARFEGTSETA